MDFESRFFAKVIPEPNSGCWLWMGWINNCGYGVTYHNYKHVFAHRASYVIAKGSIPDGHAIDHLCRIRCCVNPDHLDAVTPLENQFRGMRARGVVRSIHKTHCHRGHDLSVAGRYVNPSGGIACMECTRMHRRNYRIKRIMKHA